MSRHDYSVVIRRLTPDRIQVRAPKARQSPTGTGPRSGVFGPPKSKAGRRTMFMPDVLTDMLRAHLEQARLCDEDTDALVFRDDDGGALRSSNWRRRL
jgi:hypothetical protein